MPTRRNTLGLEVLDEIQSGELLPEPIETARAARNKPIAEMRWIHHEMAKLTAAGKSPQSVAAIMQCGVGKIRKLMEDPAFQELMAYYAEQREEIYWDAERQLAAAGMTSLGLLQQRMEQRPDSFTNRELKEVAEMAFDRSVAPLKSTQQAVAANTTITFNFKPLQGRVTTIDHEPLTVDHE